jgi:hypothetical protein
MDCPPREGVAAGLWADKIAVLENCPLAVNRQTVYLQVLETRVQDALGFLSPAIPPVKRTADILYPPN